MELKKTFALISKHHISPNQIYLLYCISNNLEPEYINKYLEIRLLPEGWLKEDLTLDKKALDLLKELKIQSGAVDIGDDNLKRYNEIFPRMTLPSGKLARSDKNNLRANFRWFFERHEYSWETIFKATEAYVDEYEAKGYLYMRTAQYFIRKQEPDKTVISELANYCSMIESGGLEAQHRSGFSDKVV